MRIACFWGEPRSLDRISFRHEHLIQGFTELGHAPFLVSARGLPGRFVGPVHLVDELDELERPAFWRELGADLAVGVTWLRKPRLLEAIAAAGVPRVAIADSDGQLGYAAHPRISWSRIWSTAASPRQRLRVLAYFPRRCLASALERDPEEREFVASARASSSIAFASAAAIAAFRRFLRPHRQAALAERCFAAPFPVPGSFCGAPILPKEDRLVAIGRWDDPQKDAPLLAAALRRFLSRRARTSVEIFGAGGDAAFGELAARENRLRLHGVQEPEVVRESLARSRALVLASRWETGPHAAGEAVALGASLVAPPLPTVAGLVDGGRFGTLATGRSPGALARALESECAHWDAGRRDPQAIAAHWRARLSPAAYCRALLASL